MIFIPQDLQQYIPHAFAGLLLIILFISLSHLLVYLRLCDSRRHSALQKSILDKKEKQLAVLYAESTAMQVRIGKLKTLLNNERSSSREKLTLLEEAKDTLRLQFQTLAQQIFDEKSERFGHENKERVSALLLPLQQQLQIFQKRIDAIQADEIRERTSLKEEILHLKELNQQVNREAVNLTRALKGDKKVQGSWGELVLERVLEISGLRRDSEYTVQKGYRGKDKQLLKPDVVVHLPDNKDIIIDSKVSLSAWEKYINAADDGIKLALLNEHVQNLRTHVDGLSCKNYSEITGLRSLDFVLMFIPIDSSFTTACDHDDKLFSDTYEKKVIIVTPTTLLATLRTIDNLWRYEHRNKNAGEIADRAAAIYDKLCAFLAEMEKVGNQLTSCSSTYESAMNKLSKGRGNLISQAGKLRELGVKTKKSIPRTLENISDDEVLN